MKNKKEIPRFIYGTAWKEDRTESLVTTALENGFTAIDTANQRKHYYEAGVGNALKKAFEQGLLRSEIFIQTKFTYKAGQDHRLPYDPGSSPAQQVKSSFESSLKHLNVDHIDSYVLHGPSSPYGLTDVDREVWSAMEELVKKGYVTYLGVSNVNAEQVELFHKYSEIKPTFVQNRCYARTYWDKDTRQFCNEHNMYYQGFSLLTANTAIVPFLDELAGKYNISKAQLIFKFSQQIGMIPLTGTTNPHHMNTDLNIDIQLTDEEVIYIEHIIEKVK